MAITASYSADVLFKILIPKSYMFCYNITPVTSPAIQPTLRLGISIVLDNLSFRYIRYFYPIGLNY